MNPLGDDVTTNTVHNVLSLVRGLRRLGLRITSADEQLIFQAIQAVGWNYEATCKDAVASVVIKDPWQYPLFAAAWHQFWLWLRSPNDSWLAQQTLMSSVMRQKSALHRSPQVIWMGRDTSGSDKNADADASDQFTVQLKAGSSRDEVLKEKDFAQLTDMELEELMKFIPAVRPAMRKTRRMKQGKKGKRLSLQGTMQKNRSTGEVMRLVRRRPVLKPRPVVLLCDVSGSMDQYSRVLLRFAHALTAKQRNFEVFVFSTRLTHVTRWLQLHDVNDAFYAVTSQVHHWSGGTRLAENLATFYHHYANTFLRRRAVLVIATDGFDSDNPAALERQLIRLSRRCQHLVWLNPALGDAEYTPTAKGAAVLDRYSDYAFAAHNFNSLTRAWNKIRRLPNVRPVRRQT
ncbi:VWA domain-containing protein [Alicyclobacillus sp. SO9]|uniref:vWA domain-containing protein n=1 Tax=Alicyclobacillus sp. SO9 TaxID=2665646 RepID=UPI0018E6E4D5|nr:VWA domain-containing protein [Alicyclobacillus sp. SO9]QQE76858.1 VWA domain-containing protein [Alicyclobacillus sp. SO9]